MSAGVLVGSRFTGLLQVRAEMLLGWGWLAVLFGSVVMIRFFTETVPVLPRFLQHIDFVVAVVGYALSWLRARRGLLFTDGVLLLLTGWWLLSLTANWESSPLEPAVLLWLSFALPLMVGSTAIRLLTTRSLLTGVLLWFVVGAALQFVTGGAHVIRGAYADAVLGTFGINNNQMAQQMVFASNIAIAALVVRRRPVAWAIIVIFSTVVILQFLAVRRAWLGWPVTLVLVGAWLVWPAARRTIRQHVALWLERSRLLIIRPVFAALGWFIALLALTGGALAFTLTIGGGTKAEEVFRIVARLFEPDFSRSPGGRMTFYAETPAMVADHPLLPLFGTGPGNFVSRTWLTSVAEAYLPFGQAFSTQGLVTYVPPTELSERYTLKYFNTPAYKEGWANALSETPLSSFNSLAYELGIPALLLYIALLLKVCCDLLPAVRSPQDDPLRFQLAFAALCGLVYLSISGLTLNVLEANRNTFPLWLLIGATYAACTLHRRERVR